VKSRVSVILKCNGINKRNHTHLYYWTPKRRRECSQKSRCARGKYRTIAIHTCEEARQRAKARAETAEFAISQRARRKAEALFAELKNYIGLRRGGYAGCFVREQFYLAATALAIGRQPLLVQYAASIGVIVANGPRTTLQEWHT